MEKLIFESNTQLGIVPKRQSEIHWKINFSCRPNSTPFASGCRFVVLCVCIMLLCSIQTAVVCCLLCVCVNHPTLRSVHISIQLFCTLPCCTACEPSDSAIVVLPCCSIQAFAEKRCLYHLCFILMCYCNKGPSEILKFLNMSRPLWQVNEHVRKRVNTAVTQT